MPGGPNIYHLYADEAGETRIERIELTTVGDTGEGVSGARVFGKVPAIHVGIGQLLDRMPDLGLHPAPARQFLVLLTGAYEIETTSGDRIVLHPGDVAFVDDQDSKGHWTRDIGDERMTMFSAAVPTDWSFSGS
jgi:hypothetical protein